MGCETIEQRLDRLEQAVREIQSRAGRTTAGRDWRRSVGMFQDDPVMKEIIEQGRRIRDDDRSRDVA